MESTPATRLETVPALGIQAILDDYACMIKALEAGEVSGVQPHLDAIKANLSAMKVISSLCAGTASATQSVIVYMITGVVGLIENVQKDVDRLTADGASLDAQSAAATEQARRIAAELRNVEAMIRENEAKLREQEEAKKRKRESRIPGLGFLKKLFYAALEAIESAIEAIGKVLGVVREQRDYLQAQLAEHSRSHSQVRAVIQALAQQKAELVQQLDTLTAVRTTLLGIQKYLQVQVVFFNDVSNFYVTASTYCDSANFNVDMATEMLGVLSDDPHAVEFVDDMKVEVLSIHTAVTRFDQMMFDLQAATHHLPSSVACDG
ncbi:hypothetical protein CCOS865_00919 [Pseudomonas reidholzensis]|uniref:Uncharacterized protein n=1 Tax=Pseudomonas reidholzensis TaxID=1785162 RepID=A0A383RNN8_9PSED|nr:hypothetical protein [Pseudomonas reidholzensis]SYX88680.1 hypothetical protein CCOS865_00919 [Pseudomonas reidholzensis]